MRPIQGIYSIAVLVIVTPDFLPILHILLASILLQPHAPLYPLLTPHLTQPGQRPRKRKRLLVAL